MPTFSQTTFSSFFKRILQFGHAGNNGTPTATTNIQAGDGVATSISLSDDVLSVQPVNDDSVGTLLCKSNAGNNILAVDTTNSKVLVGASQVAANTQYVTFGVHSGHTGWSAGTNDQHYTVPFMSNSSNTNSLVNLGSSQDSSFNDTDPSTSLTITSTADDVLCSLWLVYDNITIDAVRWLVSVDASGGTTVGAHLMSYDIDLDNGSTGGDLSNGVVLADGANLTVDGYEQVHYQAMTVQSADVNANRAIVFAFTMDGAADTSINATVKYHIR